MAFFSRLRAQRAAQRELGEGVWRRANDRFTRSLDRVFQVVEGIKDDGVYNQLLPAANDMADLQETVRQICARAHEMTPSTDEIIPPATSQVHRALTKSANDLATTAQVMAMMRMQAEAGGVVDQDAVQHRARIVKEDVERALKLLENLK